MKRRRGVVLGVGEFGYYLTLSLADSDVDLIVLDKDEARINKIKDKVEDAIIADILKEDDLSSIIPKHDLKNIDFAVIALGNLEASLLATLYFKDENFNNFYVKSISDQHSKILKKMGVNNILFPQKDTAEKLAKTLSFKTILEYIPISKDYRLVELKPINKILNKTLEELNFRKTYKLSIIALKRGNTYNFNLSAQTKIHKDDILITIGDDKAIDSYNNIAKKDKQIFSALSIRKN